MDIMSKPMSVLVNIYNVLSPEKPATLKTFSQRSKAVERIVNLAQAQGVDLSVGFNDDGTAQPIAEVSLSTAIEVEATVEALPESKVVVSDVADNTRCMTVATVKAERGPSIRAVAEGLLLTVTGIDGNGRKVGIPYDEIIATIKAQFPGAKTTVACLRWYAVHLRERDIMPPNRPRVTPKKAEANNG